jgi:hypothetical protein
MLQFFCTSKRWRLNIFLFFFCFAIVFGPAFALFDTYNYDTVANPDIKTYLGIANFDFDQSPVRKYRVIIPLLASGVNHLMGPAFSALSPKVFPGPDFALCMSFLLVNCVFVSIFGILVYRLCLAFGVSQIGAVTGLLSALTCRWTAYIAGLPLVDSLYLVTIAMALLAIKKRNASLAILCIFVGPWAKESFVFMAPLLFFFAPVNKWKQIMYFGLSALLVFSFRYAYDELTHVAKNVSLKTDFEHFGNIAYSLKRLFSFHGAYELFSIAGIWSGLFIFLLKKDIRKAFVENTPFFFIVFCAIVLIHALLSTELARMLYLASPVVAVWVATIANRLIHSKTYHIW